MKISNWCILFSVLFCSMILYTDLRFRYTMEAQYTMEEYNRIFDRAAEDALTDQLQEEYWDGSLKIDEEKVQNRFFEQTAYVLDLTGETEKENLKELVLLQKLVNEKGKSLSVEESRKIQMQMENITNQRSKLTDMAYLMLFPEAEHEEWAQNLKNHGFYTFLEMPDTERYPWTKMFDLDEWRRTCKKGRGLSLFLWFRFFDVYFFNTVFIHLFHTEQYIIICNNDLIFFRKMI